jgi:hypothetical protein
MGENRRGPCGLTNARRRYDTESDDLPALPRAMRAGPDDFYRAGKLCGCLAERITLLIGTPVNCGRRLIS